MPNSQDVCDGFEDELDTDGDGTPDGCDVDDDYDTVLDADDNCSLTANADQADADGDGMGDACDPDDDNDGNPDDADDDYDGVPNIWTFALGATIWLTRTATGRGWL